MFLQGQQLRDAIVSHPYRTFEEVRSNVKGGILITPFDVSQVAQSSVDVHLHPLCYVHNGKRPLDLSRDDSDCFDPHIIEPGGMLLTNQMFVLGATIEKIYSTEYLCELTGCSSPARKGLGIEDAGFIEAGFAGSITLELRCSSPTGVIIYPGSKIGQLKFVKIEESENYQDRGSYARGWEVDGPTLSRSHLQPRRHHK